MTQPTMGRDPFKIFDGGPMGVAGGPVGGGGLLGTLDPKGVMSGTPKYRTPPIRPMPDPFRRSDEGIPLPMQLGQTNPNQPVGFAGGVGTPAIGQPMTQPMTQPPIGQPMTQPPMGGLSYNDGFYNPTSAPRQPLTQPPAPMAMKKGGFAVKAVWDKKRPKDLGKPKDLSAKKEKSAKARAKAAGRPYPNLIDNMAAARKKGK